MDLTKRETALLQSVARIMREHTDNATKPLLDEVKALRVEVLELQRENMELRRDLEAVDRAVGELEAPCPR